jgi:DNA-binding MarR family transcriptional regulator
LPIGNQLEGKAITAITERGARVTSDGEIAQRLRAVVGKLARGLRPTLAGTGLSPTRLAVLATVVRHGPLRISELAEAEGLNPTMLSRVISELAAAGLLRRAQDPQDGRAAFVEATPAGVRLRARIQSQRNDVLRLMLAGLTEQQRRALLPALPVLEELAERLQAR